MMMIKGKQKKEENEENDKNHQIFLRTRQKKKLFSLLSQHFSYQFNIYTIIGCDIRTFCGPFQIIRWKTTKFILIGQNDKNQ